MSILSLQSAIDIRSPANYKLSAAPCNSQTTIQDIDEVLFATDSALVLKFPFGAKLIECKIAPSEFFQRLQARLQLQGISIVDIFVKGSGARSKFMPCLIRDLDFDLLLAVSPDKTANWTPIYQKEILDFFEEIAGIDRQEDEISFHFTYQGMTKTVTKRAGTNKPSAFTLDKQSLKSFGQYRQRCLVGVYAEPYPLDFNAMSAWPDNRCTSSADCHIIRATHLLDHSVPISYGTVDGYDGILSVNLLRQNVFYINPEKINTLEDGIFSYLKNITSGLIPRDFADQEKLINKFYQSCITKPDGTISDRYIKQGIKSFKLRLNKFLEDKYSQDIQEKLILLMNFEEILLQSSLRYKEKFLDMVYGLAFTMLDFPMLTTKEEKEQFFSYLKVVYYLSSVKKVFFSQEEIFQCHMPSSPQGRKSTYVGRKVAAALFKIPERENQAFREWKTKILELFPFLKLELVPQNKVEMSQFVPSIRNFTLDAYQLIHERSHWGFTNFLQQLEGSLRSSCQKLRALYAQARDPSYYEVYFTVLREVAQDLTRVNDCYELCLYQLKVLSDPLALSASRQCVATFLHHKGFVDRVKKIPKNSQAAVIQKICQFIRPGSDEQALLKLHFSKDFSQEDLELFQQKKSEAVGKGDIKFYQTLQALAPAVDKSAPEVAVAEPIVQEPSIETAPPDTAVILSDKTHPLRNQIYRNLLAALFSLFANEEDFITQYLFLEQVSTAQETRALDAIFQRYVQQYPERVIQPADLLLGFIQERSFDKEAQGKILHEYQHQQTSPDLMRCRPRHEELIPLWEKAVLAQDLPEVSQAELHELTSVTQNALLRQKLVSRLLELAQIKDLAWIETLPTSAAVQNKLLELQNSVTETAVEAYIRAVTLHFSRRSVAQILRRMLMKFPAVKKHIKERGISLSENSKKHLVPKLLNGAQLEYIDLWEQIPLQGRYRLPDPLIKTIVQGSEKLEDILIKHLKDTPKGQRVYTAAVIDALCATFQPHRNWQWSSIERLEKLSKPEILLAVLEIIKINPRLTKRILNLALESQEASIIAYAWDYYERWRDPEVINMLAKHPVPKVKTAVMQQALQEVPPALLKEFAGHLKDKTAIVNRIEKAGYTLEYIPLFIEIAAILPKPRVLHLAQCFLTTLVKTNEQSPYIETLITFAKSQYLAELSLEPYFKQLSAETRFVSLKKIDVEVWRARPQLCNQLKAGEKESEFLFNLLENHQIFGSVELWLKTHIEKLSRPKITNSYLKAIKDKKKILAQVLGGLLLEFGLQSSPSARKPIFQTLAEHRFIPGLKGREIVEKAVNLSFSAAEMKNFYLWIREIAILEGKDAEPAFIQFSAQVSKEFLIQQLLATLDSYVTVKEHQFINVAKETSQLMQALEQNKSDEDQDKLWLHVTKKLLDISNIFAQQNNFVAPGIIEAIMQGRLRSNLIILEPQKVAPFIEVLQRIARYCYKNAHSQRSNVLVCIEWLKHLFRISQALDLSCEKSLDTALLQNLAAFDLTLIEDDQAIVVLEVIGQILHQKKVDSTPETLQLFANMQNQLLRLEGKRARLTPDFCERLAFLHKLWTAWITDVIVETPEEREFLAHIILKQCKLMESYHQRIMLYAEGFRDCYIKKLWMRESFHKTIECVFKNLSGKHVSQAADSIFPLILDLASNSSEAMTNLIKVFDIYLKNQPNTSFVFFELIQKAIFFNDAFSKESKSFLISFGYIQQIFNTAPHPFAAVHLCLYTALAELVCLKRGMQGSIETDVRNFTRLTNQVIKALNLFVHAEPEISLIFQQGADNFPARLLVLKDKIEPMLTECPQEFVTKLASLQKKAASLPKMSSRFSPPEIIPQLHENCNAEFFDLAYIIEQMFELCCKRQSVRYLSAFLKLAELISTLNIASEEWKLKFQKRLRDELDERIELMQQSASLIEVFTLYDTFEFLLDKTLFEGAWVSDKLQQLANTKQWVKIIVEEILEKEPRDSQAIQGVLNALQKYKGSENDWVLSYQIRAKSVASIEAVSKI